MKVRGLEFKESPIHRHLYRCGNVWLCLMSIDGFGFQDWQGYVTDDRGHYLISGLTSTSTAEEQLDILIAQTNDHLKAAKVFESVGASVPW